MWRKILKRQHIEGWKSDDRFRSHHPGQLGETMQNRNQLLERTVISGDDNKGAPRGVLQQNQEHGLRGGRYPRNTNPSRALLEVGGYTSERRNLFRVRKNFADERQDHCLIILSAPLISLHWLATRI